MKRISVLIFVLISTYQSSIGQIFTISGTVTDAKTLEILPIAHIFLSNTTFGVVSNSDGKYVLRVDRPGEYQLIASFSGYKTYVKNLVLTDQNQIVINLQLEIDDFDLGEFVVTDKKDPKWRQRIEQFKQVFLGTSSNAARTKILNEEVIDFIYDEQKNMVEAYSSEPILIKNQALDYEIEFILEDFRIYYSQQYSVLFGYPLFKEINPAKIGRRDRLRKEAYLGSVQHFFKSLASNKLDEEGFLLRPAYLNEFKQLVITQDTIEQVFYNDSSYVFDQFKWSFNDFYVIDFNEKEPSEYEQYKSQFQIIDTLQSNPLQYKQRSWIRLEDLSIPIQFEKSGYVINPLSFSKYGFWSFEKMADRVPVNYEWN